MTNNQKESVILKYIIYMKKTIEIKWKNPLLEED